MEIYSIIGTGLLTILGYITINYNQDVKMYFISLFINIIYYYTYLEKLVISIYNQVYKINNHLEEIQIITSTISLIKNGECKIVENELLQKDYENADIICNTSDICHIFPMNKHDLNKYSNTELKVFVLTMCSDFIINYSDYVSQISFIGITVIFENDPVEYSIKLKGDNFNFYVSGNVITSNIIWYLVNSQHGINKYGVSYKISIIDNNVNLVQYTEDNVIVINKSDYENMTLFSEDTMVKTE
jgi:hypothetical protein